MTLVITSGSVELKALEVLDDSKLSFCRAASGRAEAPCNSPPGAKPKLTRCDCAIGDASASGLVAVCRASYRITIGGAVRGGAVFETFAV